MKCPVCAAQNLAGEEICASCHASLTDLSPPHPKAADQKKILEGTIRDLNPHPAVALAENQTVADAVRLMRQNKMGCVLVTKQGKLSGIFTERDILRRVAAVHGPEKVPVSEMMRAGIECLNEDDTVALAFHQMAVHDYRHIPVRRKDGSLGIVSSRDLLSYLCQ